MVVFEIEAVYNHIKGIFVKEENNERTRNCNHSIADQLFSNDTP